MKTASPGSITAGRSSMKTTVCCRETGASFHLTTCAPAQIANMHTCNMSPLYVHRYQNSDTEYETPKGYHHPDTYYDDDEQPLYRDSRRSPKRRLLPATPQGIPHTPHALQPESRVKASSARTHLILFPQSCWLLASIGQHQKGLVKLASYVSYRHAYMHFST